MNQVSSKYSSEANRLDSSYPNRLFKTEKGITKDEYEMSLESMNKKFEKLNKYNISDIKRLGEQVEFLEEHSKALKIYFDDFEKKYKVKFPKIYREFLLTVGSCTLFQDELLPGFDFLAPNELYDFTQQVFEGTDCNLFPNILITISIPRTGEQAGFLLTKENENFGVFFPDIPPEEWEEDTEFEKFEDWLENLMKEKLEEI